MTPRADEESTLDRFLKTIVPEGSRAQVREETGRILKTLSPLTRSTSLVVGRVQSGKTMSYEALICAVRDEGIPLVVVVSGISNILLDQGVRRLKGDLSRARPRGWYFAVNPQVGDDRELAKVATAIADWRDSSIPSELKRTAILFVLKNHDRLDRLNAVLAGIPISDVPVLVIDDEADQASLNNDVGDSSESTTYRRLLELRAVVQRHAYVQYTATPQAPLLIQIADTLSPDTVSLIEPGNGYVGGEDFFLRNEFHVRNIPTAELEFEDSLAVEPPSSFTLALRIFVLGLAVSLWRGDIASRTMLVHPSRGVSLHGRFFTWAQAILGRWRTTLEAPEVDRYDLEDLLREFADAHEDLATTVEDLPPLDQVIDYLRYAVRKTAVLEMNTRDGRAVPIVDWEEIDGAVLVGGQAMDRGFTVEGLTVTYMPRGVGGGNADTLEQRARFLGYKAGYFDLCRLYLDPVARDGFRNYVDHEIDLRSRLSQLSAGSSLRDWERVFLLDPNLNPTRRSVLSTLSARGRFSSEWWADTRPLTSAKELAENRTALEAVLDEYTFTDVPGHPSRTAAQRHSQSETTLEQLLAVLESLRWLDPSSSLDRTGLVSQLTSVAGWKSNPATIVIMRPGATEQRSVNDDGYTLINLFQGRSRAAGDFAEGEVYPGDRAIRSEHPTLQVHWVDVTQGSRLLAGGVPVLALWVPERYQASWWAQARTQ